MSFLEENNKARAASIMAALAAGIPSKELVEKDGQIRKTGRTNKERDRRRTAKRSRQINRRH